MKTKQNIFAMLAFSAGLFSPDHTKVGVFVRKRTLFDPCSLIDHYNAVRPKTLMEMRAHDAFLGIVFKSLRRFSPIHARNGAFSKDVTFETVSISVFGPSEWSIGENASKRTSVIIRFHKKTYWCCQGLITALCKLSNYCTAKKINTRFVRASLPEFFVFFRRK